MLLPPVHAKVVRKRRECVYEQTREISTQLANANASTTPVPDSYKQDRRDLAS